MLATSSDVRLFVENTQKRKEEEVNWKVIYIDIVLFYLPAQVLWAENSIEKKRIENDDTRPQIIHSMISNLYLLNVW